MNKFGLTNECFGIVGIHGRDWSILEGIKLGFHNLPPAKVEKVVWEGRYNGAYDFRSICESHDLFCAKQLDPSLLGKRELLEEAFRVDKEELEVIEDTNDCE